MLVDFRVTKQALRASVESYSIKEVEKLFGFVRTAEVGGGSESVNDFETWLETGDESLLDGIRDYNREDCLSLYELHRWLLVGGATHIAWRLPPDQREPTEEAGGAPSATGSATSSWPAPRRASPAGCSHLLEYHRREEKPQWWEYFHHRGLDEDELLDDGDTIGGLKLSGEPVPVARSLEYTFAFEPQEHKIGTRAVDPKTEREYGVHVDDEHGTVTLRRIGLADEPLPRTLIPPQPLPTWTQRDAVLRFAQRRDELPALVEILSGGRRAPGSTARRLRLRSAWTGATSSCRARRDREDVERCPHGRALMRGSGGSA